MNPGPDPWDARSLEWMVQSPVPAHNFDEVPAVSHLDEFWHRKYQENDQGKVVRVATGAEVAQPGDGTGVHLPSPSYWPLVLAIGLPVIGYGLIFNLGLAAVGGLIVVIAAFGWGYEPADDPEAHHGPHDHDGHDDGHDGAAAELEPGRARRRRRRWRRRSSRGRARGRERVNGVRLRREGVLR